MFITTVLYWIGAILAGAIAGTVTNLITAKALMSLVQGGESFGSSNQLGYWYFGLVIGIPIALLEGAVVAIIFCRRTGVANLPWRAVIGISAGTGIVWPFLVFLFYFVGTYLMQRG